MTAVVAVIVIVMHLFEEVALQEWVFLPEESFADNRRGFLNRRILPLFIVPVGSFLLNAHDERDGVIKVLVVKVSLDIFNCHDSFRINITADGDLARSFLGGAWTNSSRRLFSLGATELLWLLLVGNVHI
jgi:hypothetical protein